MSSYIGLVPDSPQMLVYRYYATATQGQTSVTVRAYTAGQTDVWVNGVKFIEGEDFTALNGTVINFTVALNLDDKIEIKTYEAASVANRQTMVTYEFVAGASQTTFTGLDYTPGLVMVSLNGFTLPSGDYTASDGATLTIPTASQGDDVILHGFTTFEVANALTQAVADAAYVGKNANEDLGVGGAVTKGDTNSRDVHIQSAGGAGGGAYMRLTTGDSGHTAGDGLDIILGSGVNPDAYFWNRESGPVMIGTNNQLSIKADADGRVTMPRQPAFRAQSMAADIESPVAYTTESPMIHAVTLENAGGHFNISNGRFTAPVDGTYYFKAYCTFRAQSSADNARYAGVNLWKNGERAGGAYGGMVTVVWTESSNYVQSQNTIIIELVAGDYMTASPYAVNGNPDIWYTMNGFHGYLLG